MGRGGGNENADVRTRSSNCCQVRVCRVFRVSGAPTAGIRCTCTAATELAALQAAIERERADYERRLGVLRARCEGLNKEVSGRQPQAGVMPGGIAGLARAFADELLPALREVTSCSADDAVLFSLAAAHLHARERGRAQRGRSAAQMSSCLPAGLREEGVSQLPGPGVTSEITPVWRTLKCWEYKFRS